MFIGDTGLHLSFKGFFVLYFFLVAIGVILSITFHLVGILFQVLSFLVALAISSPIALAIHLVGEKVGERFGIRFEKAEPEEIRREDDVLLQTITFSSAILLFLVNMMMEEGTLKFLLIGMIAVLAVAFYTLRAWAKIKDSAKYRYHSMNILAFLMGAMVGSVILAPIMVSVPEEFSNFSTVSEGAISNSIVGFFANLAQTVFKKRYGYA